MAQELRRVVSQPAGLRGNQARPRNLMVPHLGGTDLERTDRALDRLLGQPATGRNALAKADDARECVDDLETTRRRPRHQQPAVVGAQIERRVNALRPGNITRSIERTNRAVIRGALIDGPVASRHHPTARVASTQPAPHRTPHLRSAAGGRRLDRSPPQPFSDARTFRPTPQIGAFLVRLGATLADDSHR